MSLRAVVIVPLTTLLLTVSSADSRFTLQTAITLRIESLGRDTLAVRVSTSPLGSERRRIQPQETLVKTPVTLPVADSVGRIRVFVQAFRSVRVILTNGSASQDSIVSEGRDITLARQTADGRFVRVWTVQPLLP